MMGGTQVEVKAVGDASVDSGVPHGGALLAFTDAVMRRDASAVAQTRSLVHERLGDAGVVDAGAVMMMFNVVDRIADATGIPIDEGFTRELRYRVGSELGMDHLAPEARAAR